MATAHRIRDKHLTCSICFELYTRPKTLPCMHSFCEHCLENHIQAKRDDKGFGCPMCNTHTLMPDAAAPPDKWSSQFRTDFKLTGMLEEIFQIEQERSVVKDVKKLNKLVEDLRSSENTLQDKIELDKLALSRISVDQDEISHQIADVFSTIRLKIQRKEEALKQRLNQLCVQRKDTVSRSWLSKQKLIDQINSQIEVGERLTSIAVKDTSEGEVEKFHEAQAQFKKAVNSATSVNLATIELTLKQESIIKFDSLVFCDIETGVSSSNADKENIDVAPETPKPSEVKGAKVVKEIKSVKTVKAPQPPQKPVQTILPQTSTSGGVERPQLVAILTPTKDDCDKEPEYQDVVVLRESKVQIVVVSDYNNKRVVVLYVQQGGKTQKSIKLDGNPTRLCKLDSTKVGVSCSDPYQVMVLTVFPELKQVATIKTTINNLGIAALNPNTLAISNKNKISVVTTTGSILKEFKTKVDSSFYSMSWYMATTPTGSIIVSDRYGEVISCVTPTGQTLWQWKTPAGTPPSGVACDKQGRIYVVLSGIKEVHRLSQTGQFLGVVLNSDDDLVLPSAMDIDQFGQWYMLKKSRQIQIFKPLVN
ncbi:E3 ubiquitin-protein ligase TRIM56-like [Haliotis rufescens]|uniref:E3 ubiquitin-protein ligase TRIM56-like n=1 Tax=Haliotis rufescens TaxID=6454 RepID=UPI001EAFA776|nr:E3 ubiquitin-protein ligase TRIM56-like [Haliotis rufescens]